MPSAPLPDGHWIEPQRLMVGEYPGAAVIAETQARIDALLAAGFSYFIDLTEAGERPPYDHLLPEARADDGRYVIYVRKAIGEHAVPLVPGSMEEILEYIARALEVGHRIYLHGGTGIGRVNLVAGCWLRRAGLAADAALERLNPLWRCNPQAERQRQYVQAWSGRALEPDVDADPPLDPAVLRILRSRYQGGLIGLACADAMGASTQFRTPGHFAPVSGLIGGGQWQLPPGAWTDDTAMSLCVAESLLAMESMDPADQRRRYLEWRQRGHLTSTGQCIGITAAVSASLSREAPVGGGPEAMTRAGIIALFSASHPRRVFAWSAAAVAVTDASVAVRNAAMIYAALMLAALGGARRDELLADARDLWSTHAGVPVGIYDVALGDGAVRTRPVAGGRHTDPFAALRLVVATLLDSEGYRDGLLAIVNEGGEADLHGALFGHLAGALYGVEAIPPAWRAVVLRGAMLRDFADRLLAAALAPRD